MRLFLLLLCLTYSVASHAANRVFGDWLVSVENGVYETYTANESGSTLGLLCTESDCSFYLRAGITCERGGTYLALINSESGAASHELSCVPLTIKNIPEYVLLIGDLKPFAEVVLSSTTIGFAIPMASGQFKVSRFSLRGANKALETVVYLRKAGTTPPQKKQGIRDTTL
jgi:hypothetical protein